MAAKVMTLVLALLLEWETPTTEPGLFGYATYYDAGLMQEVAYNRGLPAYTSDYVGGVALNRAGDLGRKVWLMWGSGDVTGPYLVVDCARREHYDARIDRHLVVEVDSETAHARGFFGVGPVPVVVMFYDPQGQPLHRWR